MRDLLIRLALGSPCLGIAVWMMLQPGGPYMNLLGVFPCLAAFALIVSPSSTTVAAAVFQEFFMPDREAQPRADTKRAETLRFHQRYDAALVEYERLLQLFPQDLDLWSRCFELAWVHLRDPELAAELQRQALAAIDPPRHARLKQAFKTQQRRYTEFAERQPLLATTGETGD